MMEESLEDMQVRHRKEQKDLQSRIMQKKKNATKKTRKGVVSECDELERSMKERHEQEKSALNGLEPPQIDGDSDSDEEKSTEKEVNAITDVLRKTTLSAGEQEKTENGEPRKRNRQKERLARRAEEQEAAIAAAEKEAANQPDQRSVERAAMTKEFTSKGLVEKDIRPDGHCLFSAVADQLSLAGIPLILDTGADADVKEDQRYKIVRKAAAHYIKSHPDDFVAWLDEPLDEYVHKISDTAEWGGHLELLALAKTYNVEIGVIQNGSIQNIDPGTETVEPRKIWLAYYRHGFGLGEHYNSLRKRT